MKKIDLVVHFVIGLSTCIMSQKTLWRDDGRCGNNFLLSDQNTPGQCDPRGDGPKKGPCCSATGFCGNTPKHCKCLQCADFRNVIGEDSKNTNSTATSGFWKLVSGFLSEPLDLLKNAWNGSEKDVLDKLSLYVEKVAENSFKVLSNAYNETSGDVKNESDKYTQELTNIMDKFIRNMEDVYNSASDIVNQEKVLTDVEITDANKEKDFKGFKSALGLLPDILDLERENNRQVDGIQGYLLKLLTSARENIPLVNDQADLAWSKLKQLEVEFYQAGYLVSRTSGEVRKTLQKALVNIGKQLQDASPALKNLVDSPRSSQGS